jgi:hypothetical protein
MSLFDELWQKARRTDCGTVCCLGVTARPLCCQGEECFARNHVAVRI